MFLTTALAYPAVLLALCVGAGLALDRAAGGWLPAALLPAAGAAALIGISQLSTFAAALAPATPFVMLAVALAGMAVSGKRLRSALASPGWWRPAAAAALAYLLAMAPVLAAARTTFSSFMALSDSAVHLIGADYLLHHGQSFSHLDLRNSYGEFINGYYNRGYPSGADTLFGGSAMLLGLPLIWAFQPFNAFMLACAAGPSWLLARRAGLRGAWASLAALMATVPALTYGYELIGSVKEITALPLILALGVVAVEHRRWLWRPARGVLPFAVLAAAGFSALGFGFGLWLLVGAGVPAAALVAAMLRTREGLRAACVLVLVGAVALFVFALPTWTNLSGSVSVTQTIATTANPGNLHRPLQAIQALGVWLRGSYVQSPAGVAFIVTLALVALALALAALGALRLVRARSAALAAWVALMLGAWLAVGLSASTWVKAKEEMLTSPVAVLLVWAGVAALLTARPAMLRRLLAPLLALALVAGVLASDVAQYRASNLAPTARYQELAAVGSRFAGRGPALVSDFDEYALYELRRLDPSGPDFAYPPPALASLAGGYGAPVDLDRASPAALRAYPLIVMRSNPAQSPPPAAYRLLWRGNYYEVWGRSPGSAAAAAHVARPGAGATCAAARGLARAAQARGEGQALIAAARATQPVSVALLSADRPRRWSEAREGLVLRGAGTLRTRFLLPRSGDWQLWLTGQLMPAVQVALDGRRAVRVAGELSGNSLVPDPIHVQNATLTAGVHVLDLHRGGFSMAPGSAGIAVVHSVFLVPASLPARTLAVVRAASWRKLCSARFAWLELLSQA